MTGNGYSAVVILLRHRHGISVQSERSRHDTGITSIGTGDKLQVMGEGDVRYHGARLLEVKRRFMIGFIMFWLSASLRYHGYSNNILNNNFYQSCE